MLNSKIYEEINEKLNDYYGTPEKNVLRNKFHLEMPFGLVNDPNGLSYYDNKFHIFYQWNPLGCEHKTKHWGLVTTTDFVNFTKPKVVLKPEDWFDKNGCYSGCGIVKDDELKLYYTGNVRDANNERESYQCIATYHKDGNIEKGGVLIHKQPEGYTAHFRDPYVFVKDGLYYMVLGVQTEDLKGKALVYSSKDSKEWSLLGELKTNLHDFGYMWECPNMVNLYGDKYAFIFSPQGLESEEFKYQNIYQSGYIIGDLNLENIEIRNHTEFKELDMGFDFYAPQVFKYENKNILIGWIGMPDKDFEYPTTEQGWVYALTLPRVLEYKDDVLYQKPFDKLEALRQAQELHIENYECDEYNLELNSKGKEIILNLDMTKNNRMEIRLKFNDEYISLIYDKETEVFIIDRSNMLLGGKGIRKIKLKAEKELKLHMFIDSSVVEIYYQDGLEVTTFMYFPNEEQLEIQIKDDNNVKINELSMWDLRSVNYEK